MKKKMICYIILSCTHMLIDLKTDLDFLPSCLLTDNHHSSVNLNDSLYCNNSDDINEHGCLSEITRGLH